MQAVKQEPMYRFLIMLTIASTVGLQGWRTLFNNFAVETVGLEGNHIGMIQSVREVPGFLALLVIFILFFIKEHRLSALAIIITGVGVGMTGFFPSYLGLIVTTLIMSTGFHYYETINQSLTLQYFPEDRSPWVFGKQRSYAAATNIFVGIFIFAAIPFLSYLSIYLTIGGAIVVIGIWGFMQDPTKVGKITQHKRMILRKKYWLFYLLTFMSGTRRQIFVAFAIFLMVKVFGYSVQEVSALFVINNIINYFLSPLIGLAIIRFGERKMLSLEYISLVFIFCGYAFTSSKRVVAALYILDHIFFNFTIGIRTYFQKISTPKDLASSMAVGFTINHIAAVIIPALGGLLWVIDYRIPFLAAAGMSIISLISAQFIRATDFEITPPRCSENVSNEKQETPIPGRSASDT
ncbi:MAG: hypothetical protein B6244_12120 [Candidatus Cloacimonetes bacterium 4572_55]|nr:MAG: hypothetical protein B6244_12120 [Candidatus Cloacimonetes bacterium 4572_55]